MAFITKCPSGILAPHSAISSSRCSATPLPEASAPLTTPIGATSRLASTPGTATAATGIAMKLSAIPTGATAPSSHAVTGAVATVAPTDDAADCHSQCFPPASSAQRAKRTAPHSDSTDNQPPRSNTANGSSSMTTSPVAASSASGCTARCRQRSHTSTHAIAPARTAGAGHPRNATYTIASDAATVSDGTRDIPSCRSTSTTHAAMSPM